MLSVTAFRRNRCFLLSFQPSHDVLRYFRIADSVVLSGGSQIVANNSGYASSSWRMLVAILFEYTTMAGIVFFHMIAIFSSREELLESRLDFSLDFILSTLKSCVKGSAPNFVDAINSVGMNLLRIVSVSTCDRPRSMRLEFGNPSCVDFFQICAPMIWEQLILSFVSRVSTTSISSLVFLLILRTWHTSPNKRNERERETIPCMSLLERALSFGRTRCVRIPVPHIRRNIVRTFSREQSTDDDIMSFTWIDDFESNDRFGL